VSLIAGTQLGPYEILALIGRGGMGEVYRARDTRLGRLVAIKIVSESLAADPGFRDRFDREATAISRLAHPNICSLFDVGKQNGTAFLVMEYLEGETLESRLKTGALSLENALAIAEQLASALSVAHRHGVVHRDLKPGNIMLLKSGAKLLDFGVARVRGTPADLTDQGAETRSTALTATSGMLVGTLHYLAPELLEGQEPDPRSDIWAFGCVLYEMLSGRKAFNGPGPAAVIGAIARDHPPAALPDTGVGGFVNDLIRNCLAKAPEDRIETAHDVGIQLTSIAAHARSTLVSPRVSTRSRLFLWTAIAVVSGGLGLAVAVLGRTPRPRMDDHDRLTLSVAPAPERIPLSSSAPLAFSPNGVALAYAAADSAGVVHLWYRNLGDGPSRVLPGTDGASQPFFSPDGSKLGFFARGELKTISVTAGNPEVVASVTAPIGGTWGAGDTILFCPSPPAGILSVKATGGGPVRQVVGNPATNSTSADRTSFRLFSSPTFLPDGHHFLYRRVTVQPGRLVDPGVFLGSVDDQTIRKVLSVSSNVAYSEPGFLLFIEGDSLVAQSFDSTQFEVSGDLRLVAEHVLVAGTGAGAFAASSNGRLGYLTAGGSSLSTEWVDRTGRHITSVKGAEDLSSLALSPNELWIAGERLDRGTRTPQIWAYDLTRNVDARLTDGQSNSSPVWSADSSAVFYAALRGAERIIEAQPINGAPRPTVIARLQGDMPVIPESVTRDGRFLSFERTDPRTREDVWVLPLSGDRRPFPVIQTPAAELQSRFSPNGSWLAYTSNETSGWQVYVQPFPTNGKKWQVSIDGGGDPQWSSDSTELFYLTPAGMLMSVTISGKSDVPPGAPASLFLARTADLVAARNHYVVGRDGRRFLFTGSAASPVSLPITIVINWFEDLKVGAQAK
jgi:serine/threonine protein kinase